MSKAHRGRVLKKEGYTRGTCPITGIQGVKLLYEYKDENDETVKISKVAYARINNKKRKEAQRAKAQRKPNLASSDQENASPSEAIATDDGDASHE